MDTLLAVSKAIERAVEKIAFAAGALFFALTFVICFDVLTRKLGYQLPGFGSTRLQELEWHLHAAIFSFWLGFAYIRNAHVRIDVVTSHLRPRIHGWLELLGCVLFALPFCLIALYFGVDYTLASWRFGEASESISGLPYRFIPKGIIALGILLLLAAVVSVALRVIVFTFGPQRLRRASAYAGAKTDTGGRR
jgi:TRAP-type mannitol/chloroaromatic compound transport system permease small subunit